MDKSEGTDFISKTFSSFSETVARWYHKQQKSMTISQLKRTREEKAIVLGNKVAELLKNNKLSAKALENEYLSIVQIDNAIAQAEDEMSKLKQTKAAEASKPAKGRKKASGKEEAKESKAVKGRRKTAVKESEPAKKRGGAKPAAAKTAKKAAAETAAKPVAVRKRRVKKPLELPAAERKPVSSDKLPAHFEE